MQHLFPHFLANIRKHRLIESGDTVIAGFSGGKDSTVMLLLLQELQKEISFRLVAAYFNHRLRADSSREEEWVTRFCLEHGIELVKGDRNVLEFKREEKLNLEHAASLSRYDFFRRAASLYANAKIATAHTRSDLAETFFIKLFRGSGLQGLSAIYQKKESTLIRPLLLFSTEEIQDFLDRNQIPFYQDHTNQDYTFLRNRIRLRLMPAVRQIEPAVDERVYRTVSLLQDEYDHFYTQAHAVLRESLILGKILPFASFKHLHPALQRHIAREYIRILKGNLLNIGVEHIEEILHTTESRRGLADKAVPCGLAEKAVPRGLSIPGLDLRHEKGFLFPAGIHIPAYEFQMAKPGVRPIPEIGMSMCIRSIRKFRKPSGNREIVVPGQVIRFPLTVRCARKGDAYRKIHSPYRQNVLEMIRSSGIPHRLRHLCPLLLNVDGRIIWVYGSPVADEFKVEPKHSPPFSRITLLPLREAAENKKDSPK